MGVAYTSTIQWMRGYKVFECATTYMWVISQNTLSLIIAPRSVEIEDDNRLWNLLAGVMYIPSLMSFGVCSGSENAIIWNEMS